MSTTDSGGAQRLLDDQIEPFLQHLRDAGYAERTLRKKRTVARSFARWAQLEEEPQADPAAAGLAAALPAGVPVAALLDGMPVQAHSLLANRLVLDDPDNLQARALVARRVHGTAMASLILHGRAPSLGASFAQK